METRPSEEMLGCGSSQSSEITLNIQTTTGGNFSITVESKNTVDQLKKIVSKKLKVSKDRICLLHRERQLRDGTLKDNGLVDGSRVILLPSVETGLLTQRPENSVMQALESLNDSQVNDFLSGKSPLNLTMRLGDHMMLIQLQLSTLHPVVTHSGNTTSQTSAIPSTSRTTRTVPTHTSRPQNDPPSSSTSQATKQTDVPQDITDPTPCKTPDSTSNAKVVKPVNENIIPETVSVASDEKKQSPDSATDKKSNNLANTDEFKSFLRKQGIETLQNAIEIFKSLAEMQEDIEKESEDSTSVDSSSCSSKLSFDSETPMEASSTSAELNFDEQSPIKSLSNLVSSPLKSVIQSSYSPMIVPSTVKYSDTDLEDKPPPAVKTPKYVPLPSSLKNNLIESLVGGCSNSEKSDKSEASTSADITDPIAANLTSCLCSTLNPDFSCSTNCHPSHNIADLNNTHTLMETDFHGDTNVSTTKSCFELHPSTEQYANFNEQGLIKVSVDSARNTEPVINDSLTTKPEKIIAISENPGPSTSRNSSPQEVRESSKNKRLHYLLHKTSKYVNPISHNKQKAFMQSVVNKHLKKKSLQNANEVKSSTKNSNTLIIKDNECVTDQVEPEAVASTSKDSGESVFRMPKSPAPLKVKHQAVSNQSNTVSDTKALIEASKNLTQTLKKLSKEVLTSKVDLSNEENTRAKIGQGAVIESMKHHGKGIYSGTFSGTLNPALQDRFGRPKRDISTIIHILNDLLCATPPQYRRGARITFEPTHNSTSSSRNKPRESRSGHQSTGGRCGGAVHENGECECSKCKSGSAKCPYGECNGHYPPTPTTSSSSPDTRCSCKPLTAEDCACSPSPATHRPTSPPHPYNKCLTCLDRDDKLKKTANKNCKKCHSANALALDNSKTKCKLDQLRLVMQQKKQRREARKMKAAPYVTTTTNVTPLQNEAQNVIAEEIETLA